MNKAKSGEAIRWAAEQEGRHRCGCGCGGTITVRPRHYQSGVPSYLLGHNPPWQERRRSVQCGCGCGAMTTPGRRFLTGHNARGTTRSAETRRLLSEQKTGPRNHRYGTRPWNYIGRKRAKAGYIQLVLKEHPFRTAIGNLVMEHRVVVERHLRRLDPASPHLIEVDGVLYLRPGVEVHHIDGRKDHNVISNLQVMSKSEHARLHAKKRDAL